MAVERIRIPQDKIKMFRSISTIVIIIFLFTSCSFPGFPESKNELFIDSENGLAADSVNVQFILQIPDILPLGESIALEILDEVTGLSYKNQTFGLEEINKQEYTTNLTVPAGSVLKYRYIKTGQVTTPEAQYLGESVRYRLFYADNDNSVTDILYTWQGETSNQGLGVLTGVVRDQESDFPIPDILVSAGGQLTFTNANGEFVIGGIPQGEHNVMFYAMDGKYAYYQQGAQISPGLTTPAIVNLHLQMPVKVSFSISPPGEAIGAPMYIAGNVLQLGNTFSSLYGSASILPKNMPVIQMGDDGRYKIELLLYSGTDLRYKFTLGDGYWNAEQRESGGFRVRQLIVPSNDINLDINIDTWQSASFAPITFLVSIPYETSPRDEKFIQFKSTEWAQPLPLWPVGDAEYLYILFPPTIVNSPISYRFCRNADCQNAINLTNNNSYPQIIPSDTASTITNTIDTWEYWQPKESTTTFPIPPAPNDIGQYVTSIELTPEMNPSWPTYAPFGLRNIAEMGTKSVIFSPQWFLNPAPPYISPESGKTPYYFEIIDLMNEAKSLGLDRSLYPQLSTGSSAENWWLSRTTATIWWDEWMNTYRQFILDYAEIAEQTEADQLILGGKAVLPTFMGGILPDGRDPDAPETVDSLWMDLIEDVRESFNGDLIWATNVSQKVDPLPDFINQLDGIYVIVDSPLSSSNEASFEDIAYNFTGIIDNLIYEIYRSTQLPITIALAYPSVDGAVRGCTLLNDTCYNDGLFLKDEIDEQIIDLDEQALIYSSVLPVIASRGWITGTSIRGYSPTVISLDGTSSIAGKPASEVIEIWFTNIKAEQN